MENSSFGRLIGVLVAPEKTFRSIAERPTWVVALVVLTLFAVGVGLLATAKIDMEDVIRTRIEQSNRELSEAEMDQAIEIGERFRYVGPAVAVIIAPIMFVIMAAVFLLAINLLGGSLTFKSSLSTSLYGLVPSGVVSGLLAIPVILSKAEIDAEMAQGGRFLASSLAYLAPEETSPVMLSLLGSVDIFSIWALVLLTMGYSIVGNVSKQTWATVTVVLWLAWIGIKVGFTALFN
jgi:hypothetical protein